MAHRTDKRAPFLTPARRKRLYEVFLAVVPILIAYGAVSADAAPLWIALAGAILVGTTARANVDSGPAQ